MLIATGPDNNPIEVQADANGNLKTSISGSLPNQGGNWLWTPLSIIDNSVGANKVVTVPTGKQWEVLSLSAKIQTTATVGNRTVLIGIDNGTVNEDILSVQAPSVAASTFDFLALGMSYPKDTAYDSNKRFLFPIPKTILNAGDHIRLKDNSTVDLVNDTITYHIRVLERSV